MPVRDPKDDGGPAFPTMERVGMCAITSGGLTIRDWLDGHALAGLLASRRAEGMSPETVAIDACAYADAMLAERAK